MEWCLIILEKKKNIIENQCSLRSIQILQTNLQGEHQ